MTPAQEPPAQDTAQPKASAPQHPSLSPPADQDSAPGVMGQEEQPAGGACPSLALGQPGLTRAEHPLLTQGWGPLTSDMVDGAELRGWAGEPRVLSWKAERAG